MGLSNLPAPSEGMLCIILVNTAMSISIIKGILRSILKVIGIRLSESSSPSTTPGSEDRSYESLDMLMNPNVCYLDEFRSHNPSVKFDTLCCQKNLENDCSVCLTEFKPESEINLLSCGHLFHKVCLEKWLDYWNFTCPLCRTPLVAEFEEGETCYW